MTYYVFSSLINLATASYLGLILAKNRSKYIYYILDNLSVAFWAFFYLLWQITTDRAQALIYCQLLTVGSVFMPYFFTLFIQQLIPTNKAVKRLVKLNHILLATFIPLSFTPLLIGQLEPILNFKFWPKAGALYPFFLVYFIGNFLFDCYLLFREYFSKNNKDQTYLYILLAIIIAFIGGSTNYFLWFDVPIPPLGNILLSLHVSIITFALLKKELMDIKLVLSKSGATVITFLLLLVIVWFMLTFARNAPFLLQWLSLSLAIFVWVLYGPSVREFLITSAKRAFVKGYYDANKILTKITDGLEGESNRQQILTQVITELDNAFELEKVGIVLAIRDQNNEIDHYDFIVENKVISILQPADTLISGMLNCPGVVAINDTEAEIVELFVKLGYREHDLLLPLSSPECLEGILVLGERSSGKPYRQEDVDFLKQLKTVLQALFYKLTPYEKLQTAFEANQKKLHDSERNLARTEKIASLARVIQEYNHEIKTPLSILGMTVRRLKAGDDLDAFKADVNELIARANDIVETTLRISKPREHRDVPVNLIEVLETVLRQFPPDGVHLVKQFDVVPDMVGDPDDLHVLFTNLFKNAYEAMPSGGTLTVRAYTETDNYATYAMVDVSDTGTGIAKEDLERIWDPFFSTHVTKGRGLGLSLAFRIAREHLGSIQVESTLGQGSTFKVQLKAIAK